MSVCTRPLDPIDAQAVASGGEPLFARDAAEHARVCGACQALVDDVSRFSGSLEALSLLGPPADFADRVLRLRAFSARERRSLRFWGRPVALSAGVFASGVFVLALPGLQAGERASLSLAAVLPALSAVRALGRTALDTVQSAPPAVEALAQSLSGHGLWGLLCLLLLAPLSLGLRRVLARAPKR